MIIDKETYYRRNIILGVSKKRELCYNMCVVKRNKMLQNIYKTIKLCYIKSRMIDNQIV